MLRIGYCFILSIFLAGCSQFDMSKMKIPNPFSEKHTDVNDVYYDSFCDISIPKDMKVDKSRTFVSVGADGEKLGLLTLTGYVDKASLCSAMIHNMSRQGWTLRGVVDAKQSIQLYKKKDRYSILYISGQRMATSIEIWVLARLDEGAYNVKSSTGNVGIQAPFFSSGEDDHPVELNQSGLTE